MAALLAHSGAPAPEGVWNRILDELEPAPPALRMPSIPGADPTAADANRVAPDEASAAEPPGTGAAPDELASRRHSIRTRVLAAVLAVAAAIVAVLGVVTIRQSQRLDQMDTAMRQVSLARVANQALADPRSTSAKLTSGDGRVAAPVVVTREGEGYLLASKLPRLPDRRTYQLWGQVQGSLISLGVFDGPTDVVAFRLGADSAQLKGFAVTEEVSPGVSVSRNQPVLKGAI